MSKFEITKVRSSRPEVFCKKGALRNFTKFTGEHLRQCCVINSTYILELSRHLTIFVLFYVSNNMSSTEAVAQRCFVKKVILKISQNHRKAFVF